MDQKSIPNTELDSPHSPGQPGEVIGPGGPGASPQNPVPQSPPATTPPLAPVTAPTVSVLPMPHATTSDQPRPTAVADSTALDSSMVLPPAVATVGAMPLSGTTVSANKKPLIIKFAGKRMLLLVALPLVLLGSSAAAYFGYVMPNQPQNVLAKAIANTLSQHQFTTTGVLDITASGLSGKVEYTVKADADNHATDSQVDITVSGVKAPVELLTAKGNVYFKVGSISGLSGALNVFLGDNSQAQTLEDQINTKLANQWVEIDSTLLKEVKLSCLSDYPAVLSPGDIQALQDPYKKNSFAIVTSNSSEEVNGRSTYKYEIQIDDNKLADFKPDDSTYFKNLKSCLNSISQSTGGSTSSLKDNDKTPLTLWVDKKTKTLVKYESKSTAQDKHKADLVGTLTGTITYDKVSISPPSNTKSVLDVLAGLDLGNLGLDGLSGGGLSSSGATDAERKTDINAMHGQIEAYQATNGFYPTFTNMNDAKWRAANLVGLQDEALKEPSGTSATLAATPGVNIYSYQVLPAGCDNVKVQCQDYTLTATLSDGTTYVKQSLNDSSSSILN